MSLQPEMFNQICSGAKQIEIRLYDEKRQKIQKGDLITLTSVSAGTKSV